VNDVQRQLLADRIDEVSRRIERYEKDIILLESKASKKRVILETCKKELAELQEGVDW
jgi:predicted DNA-binding protein YlxM (UPF0122 family)